MYFKNIVVNSLSRVSIGSEEGVRRMSFHLFFCLFVFSINYMKSAELFNEKNSSLIHNDTRVYYGAINGNNSKLENHSLNLKNHSSMEIESILKV